MQKTKTYSFLILEPRFQNPVSFLNILVIVYPETL